VSGNDIRRQDRAMCLRGPVEACSILLQVRSLTGEPYAGSACTVRRKGEPKGSSYPYKLCLSWQSRSTKVSDIINSIQPAQQFGAVLTGILPSKVAEDEGSQETTGNQKRKTKRPALAKTPQSGASPQDGAPSVSFRALDCALSSAESECRSLLNLKYWNAIPCIRTLLMQLSQSRSDVQNVTVRRLESHELRFSGPEP
jgi:hypothetical protein